MTVGEQAEFDRRSARIVAGRGVVARFPGVLCVADAADPEPVRAFLALCAAVAGFEPGRPLGRRLAAWLMGQGGGGSGLRFGTLADAGDRWAVFLSGAVSLHGVGADTDSPGPESLRGADSAAWVDRLMAPSGALTLALDDRDPDDRDLDDRDPDDRAPAVADPPDVFADLHDLRAGAVPGRGVVLFAPGFARSVAAAPPVQPTPHAAPALEPSPPVVPVPPPAAAPAAAPDAVPPAVAAAAAALVERPPLPDEEPEEMTIGDGSAASPLPPVAPEPPVARAPRRAERIDRAPAPQARPPLPVGRPLSPAALSRGPDPRHVAATAVAAPPAVERRDDAPVVEGPRTRGHLCSRGHLNDPRSHFCVLCGIRMNERTGELVFGARPPLGLLVFDDGATYTVDAEYLVGRMPDVDDRVRSGALRSIVVEDRSGAISRVHAEVRVQGWDVLLVDSRSRNGTHFAEPGAAGWTPLPAGRSHHLTPGTRVRLGSRTFLFESPSGVR